MPPARADQKETTPTIHRIASGRVKGFSRDWSLPRQIDGQSVMAEAARSTISETLRLRLKGANWVGTSICPCCAVGCAQFVYAKDGKPIHIEGDPRSPVTQGTLCPKGAGTLGVLLSPERISQMLHRARHSDHWEERPLDWDMERVAQLTKQARDKTFVERLPDGKLVNHTVGVASLGGATLDNEENDLIEKLFGGGLGVVSIENQARR